MSTTHVLAIGVLAASSGCLAPPPATESVAQPIVAGAADPADPAMVELFAIQRNSVAKCTATLITPRILLTAAHCIFETQGARYRVFLGNDDGNVTAKDLLPVTAAVFDPMYSNNAVSHDIGVVVLAAPLSIAPVPMNRDPLPATAVGQAARYVGYGLTDGVAQRGDGRKRAATAPIAQITQTLIRIGKNAHGTCNGDSGGPLLMDTGAGEAVIGVVSFGDDATCRTNSFFQRLDTQLAFVDQQIKKYDPGVALPDAGRPAAADGAAPPVRSSDAAPIADVAPPDPPGPGPLDAAAPPPDSGPGPDLGALPSPPAPVPAPDAGATGMPVRMVDRAASGGCSCAVGHDGGHGGAVTSLAGLLLAWASVRRRHGGRRAAKRASSQGGNR
jgi:MYXO-CTERM domain-containing protein